MSTTLTNSNLTQIAVKRLSGKAMTNSNSAIPAEKFGSTIQSSATTIFGQSVPNNPSTASAELYRIQSASDGGPGTVQLVTFDVVAIGSEYANTDDSNLYSDEVAVGADTGDSYGVTTYHAYALKLTGSYEEDVTAFGGSDYFANNASTPKVIGTDPEFSNNFISTGSTQFQIVPEYLSTVAGTTNPYIPIVSNTSGDDFYDPAGFISATDGIDYYLDTFAGILFVQDPAQYGTPDADGASQNSGATIPKRVRAFLYTGKYQSEIEGGNFHISGSEGGGFSLSGTVTASFETGSGEGLTITADPNANSLTFELNDVISGSAGIWHISASEGNGAGIGAQQTASFEDGGAGLTVRRGDLSSGNGSKVLIGTTSDNVTFTNITALGDIIAQNYIVSSSVTYMTQSFLSGSTIFGDTVGGTYADTHQFTGSIFVTGSTFTWDGLGSSDGTTPLVIDENGNITSGPAFAAATGIHLSASGDAGFTLQSSETASFKSDNTQLTIDATPASNEILFTVGGGVISGSGQILSGSGILSSSTQDFAAYSSSVETLISDATASIEVNETNITALQASASAGIFFSASNGGTSIALTETASFEGGDGITITNSNGTLTIESDYGELNSPIFLGTGSDAANATGSSIAYNGTASFSASGAGLSVDTDGSAGFTYTITPNTVIEAVDTATVINITASYAESASVATSASYALSSSYAVTASYAENAGSVSLTEETNSTAILGVVFSDLEDDVLKQDGTVNENVTLQGAHTLGFVPNNVRPQLFVSGGTGTTTHTVIEHNAIGSDASTYNILTGTDNTTINVSTPLGTVFFKGSASIDGDLIVKGSTTTLNTQNLLVEDQFVLLASGSAGSDGGIVVERSVGGIGTALFWDETNDVWAIDTEGVNANTATTANADVVVVSVSSSAANPTGNPALGASADYRYGQMYISTTDNDGDGNQIWIYAP